MVMVFGGEASKAYQGRRNVGQNAVDRSLPPCVADRNTLDKRSLKITDGLWIPPLEIPPISRSEPEIINSKYWMDKANQPPTPRTKMRQISDKSDEEKR
ncbi:hypothetical protein BO79DRAFT_202409 [Aspergillus costaricaensis CBS 115574]|uniref:Uncharacterized protein n=1 Tax=Aspergillus costaricaensis CBS 115574 TaxID=1448317 RepID=A0ACD1I3Q1_9EURO|nr:hypothetical protein BO79DRAFT_202409 [Aspergillus costaricaensis CBS 115574]RAK84688.1 hypothetical protein BO79DRAFT_202409 [Aspergillus costaricaensis CBS 115574]